MIKSYLKTAWRNLLRHRGASLIKLAGLSIGMACCMLIFVYLTDELSYNKFNAHCKEIYRVNYIKDGDGQFRKSANTPAPGGPAIVQEIPQAFAVGRLYSRGGMLEVGRAEIGRAPNSEGRRQSDGEGRKRSDGDMGGEVKRFQEPNICFADNGLFDIFSMYWSEGRAADALVHPNSIVLTREDGWTTGFTRCAHKPCKKFKK